MTAIRRLFCLTMLADRASQWLVLAALVIGIGSILPRMPFGWPIAFLFLGLAIHSGGMVRANRADAKAGLTPPFWFQAITWLCWIVLVGLAASAAYLLST